MKAKLKARDRDRLLATLAEVRPRKGDLRRMRCIELAIDCIAKEGVDSLTFDWVARRARMSRSHVIYYFADREDLIQAAVRFVCKVVETYVTSAVQSQAEPRAMALAAVAANFDCFLDNPRYFPVILLLLARGSRSKKDAAFVREVREIGAARWKTLLRLVDAQRVSSEDNSADAAYVQALVVGYLTRLSEGQDPKLVKTLRAECLLQVEKYLDVSHARS